MAYTKKTWVKGSTPLSAENFNHMELGIADAHTDIKQLNSDMERTKNIVFQSCGSGTSISVTMKNRNTINKTCDKMPLFVIGNGNGIPMCAIILINMSGANISVDQVTNLTGYNLNCSASGDLLKIYNIPNWGYFMVIAPPGVYLDQSSNVI